MADMIPVEGEDAELNAATDEARRTLPEFRKVVEEDWRRLIPVIDRPLIKARFESARTGKSEHMWVEVMNFDGEIVVGELANEPSEVPELSQGDEVRVTVDDVSDWVYWQGDSTVGGFTLTVLERREQNAAAGENFEGDNA
jgi:uncharacterized protein YegJ (DUF2314 family)